MLKYKNIAQVFGHFEIVRKLGNGHKGTVYLADDTKMKCRVALKVVQWEDEDRLTLYLRLLQEAFVAQSVHHPYLSPVYEVGIINNTLYLTMPVIEGTPLDRLVGKEQMRDQRKVAELVCRLAQGLQALHETGWIHRDLKPGNIMVKPNGEPVLIDFHLAYELNGDQAPLVFVGTPPYMSPEQATGDSDAIGPASDIYSLGVVLYELLTGQYPLYPYDPQFFTHQVLKVQPKPPSTHRPDVDKELEAICLKAMAKKVKSRFRTMAALVRRLEKYLKKSSSSPIRLKMTVPGDWYSRSAHSPSSDWEEVIRTPGMVILRPDEEYRLMVRNAATDKEVAGLSHLPSLKQLHLSGAKVTDAGLTPVGELTSLQQLAVSYCQEVTDVGLAVMERLVHLEHLELCSMNVTDTGLAHLRSLVNLQYLDLATCKNVTDAGVAHLRALTKLQHLNLTATKVSDAGLAYLQNLTSLHCLQLNDCTTVTPAGLASLQALTNLQSLSLVGVEVTDVGFGHLQSLSRLDHLDVNCDRVTDAGLACLEALTRLQFLNLSNCKSLTDAGFSHLRTLNKLQHLELKDCSQVTDVGMAHLQGFSNLEYLDLSHCGQLTDAGLCFLQALTRLQRLILLGCDHVTEEGLRALRRALPWCGVSHYGRIGSHAA